MPKNDKLVLLNATTKCPTGAVIENEQVSNLATVSESEVSVTVEHRSDKGTTRKVFGGLLQSL